MLRTHGKWGATSVSGDGKRYRMVAQLPTINSQPKIQESVEPVGSKQIWLLSTGCWQLHQRNKHNQVHPQVQSTYEQIEGCNIRSVCLHQMTWKGGTKSNPFHRWRGSNQLPRGGSHIHSRPTCCQNPVQQHNINAWGKIHDNGYLKLLSQLAVSPPRVHSNQNKQHPRGDYQWIQPMW